MVYLVYGLKVGAEGPYRLVSPPAEIHTRSFRSVRHRPIGLIKISSALAIIPEKKSGYFAKSGLGGKTEQLYLRPTVQPFKPKD
jgi:hypothetical protein